MTALMWREEAHASTGVMPELRCVSLEKPHPSCGEQVVTDVQHTVRLQELNDCNVLLCLISMTTCAASPGAF